MFMSVMVRIFSWGERCMECSIERGEAEWIIFQWQWVIFQDDWFLKSAAKKKMLPPTDMLINASPATST